MKTIQAYELSDGSLHKSKSDARKHLEKLETPWANFALNALLGCGGQTKNFVVLLQDGDFLKAVARLLAYKAEAIEEED